MKNQTLDLVIIGGGIMGLMTAYYASRLGKNVVILEKLYVGNKYAASFSLTRSIRNDYLDPFYSRLARESRGLWEKMEKENGKNFIINCGCLNLANKKVTPTLSETYAQKSYRTITSLGFKTKYFSKKALKKRFPQFEADLATLDVDAGFLYLPEITKTLATLLDRQGVKIIERAKTLAIEEKEELVSITTNKGIFKSKNVVLTSGIWINDVLKIVKNCKREFPIIPDRPKQCKYYIPPKNKQELFQPDKLPVFAYLDVGIYGHPFYKGKTKGVKIGFYNPPDFETKKSEIKNISDFVRICMPSLGDAKVIEVRDADQCYYDMIQDDEFILGKLPNYSNIYVGAGWRGTGYKFAPIIGKILSELSIKGKTGYDIERFSPDRFERM